MNQKFTERIKIESKTRGREKRQRQQKPIKI